MNKQTVSARSPRGATAAGLFVILILLVFAATGMVGNGRKLQRGLMTVRGKNGERKSTSDRSLVFPREPKLTPGCSVKFQHTNMSLCYFLPYGANFGDELGPAVVKRILEYELGCSAADVHIIDLKTSPEKRKNRTCLFAVGSIFHNAKDGDHIWGTGINPMYQGRPPTWLHVHAVRGNETEGKMKEWYNYTSLPYLDPGFLMPSLYQDYYHLPTKSIGVKPDYAQPKFCFIPHAHDLSLDAMKSPPPELTILSVKQHWEPMFEQIRTCDYVVSTSLHGVVVADALGIPSKWFQFNASKTQTTEGSFKYHDYLWSIGRNVSEPERTFDMAVFNDTSTYMAPIPFETRNRIVQKFLSSFPHHVFRKSLVPLQPTKVLPNCTVKFQDRQMALCVPSKATGFVGDIGVTVVKRLLENRFGCSADNLPIMTVQEREEGEDSKQKCFFAQGDTIGSAIAGDHVWGAGAKSGNFSKVAKSGNVPTSVDISSVRGPDMEAAVRNGISSNSQLPHGDPAFLLPYLHREYLVNETNKTRLSSDSQFCYIPSGADDEQAVSGKLPSGVSLVSTKLSLGEALKTLQRCDSVASLSLDSVILADSLGIPTKRLQINDHDFELADYLSSSNRKVVTIDFDKILDRKAYIEPLSQDERESFADQTAASFPFDLFDQIPAEHDATRNSGADEG